MLQKKKFKNEMDSVMNYYKVPTQLQLRLEDRCLLLPLPGDDSPHLPANAS